MLYDSPSGTDAPVRSTMTENGPLSQHRCGRKRSPSWSCRISCCIGCIAVSTAHAVEMPPPCTIRPKIWTGFRRRASTRSTFFAGVLVVRQHGLLLAGISPNVMLWVGPFTTATSAFVHANLNWTLGPFKYVLASPVFHRWHHTSRRA